MKLSLINESWDWDDPLLKLELTVDQVAQMGAGKLPPPVRRALRIIKHYSNGELDDDQFATQLNLFRKAHNR